MRTWVLIRSWHAVKGPSSFIPGAFITLCGRRAYGQPVDVLPAGRSCESCLRIFSKGADR